MHKPVRTLVSAAIVGLLATHTAHSGEFSLYTEGSAAAIGNYAAGIAAEAADASTGWYNPAGLALIHKQEAVFGGVGVFPSAKLTGTSTFRTLGAPDYVQGFSGLEAGDNALVPSFHYALPVGENLTFGLSAISPFGLATNYSTTSPVRYAATFSELITTNISPEFGAKITDHFAVGAGLDLQYARVKFNTMIGTPTALPIEFATAADTLSYNNGNSFGVGFHIGLMSMFNDNHTRVGVNYQSQMRHNFHGQSRLTGRLAVPGLELTDLLAANGNTVFKTNSLFSNPIEFPDIVTLSGYHDLNDRLALLGSFVYTGWSSFNRIQLNNVAAPAISNLGTVSQVLLSNTKAQNYRDAWRVAVGANYHVNEAWMLRVGGGYDETPTTDAFRDVRLPDSSRWALSVGAHYQWRPAFGVDLGYTHLFADNARINRTDAVGATSSYNVNAAVSAGVDLVGAQLVWTMDKVDPMPTK